MHGFVGLRTFVARESLGWARACASRPQVAETVNWLLSTSDCELLSTSDGRWYGTARCALMQ